MKCLRNLKIEHDGSPLFFIRYIDDVILCINSSHTNLVLKVFNEYHERLKFTYELEKDKTLNFLDITATREGEKLVFNWYQKPQPILPEF